MRQFCTLLQIILHLHWSERKNVQIFKLLKVGIPFDVCITPINVNARSGLQKGNMPLAVLCS